MRAARTVAQNVRARVTVIRALAGDPLVRFRLAILLMGLGFLIDSIQVLWSP